MDEKDGLRHLLSLRFTSLLTSLDHSWLVWVESSLLDVSHILMFGKREVRTFEPPILPSIPQHIPSPSSDRWRTFVEVRIDHILSPSSGSHYSLESTSLVTAALNAGASMTSLDPDLDLDLSPSLSSVTFLVYFSRVLQIINQ